MSAGLPLLGEFDLAVIGGGPAGLAAAAASAQNGCRTVLVERYGFLGGMGTAGGVTNFAGLYARHEGRFVQVVHGVVDELLQRIDALGGLNQPQDGMQGRIRVRSYDVSAYKCAADAMLLSRGVTLLFHTLVCGVVREAAGDLCDGGAGPDGTAGAPGRAPLEGQPLTALEVESKSGRQLLRARAFIDCSGDADVAALAGVPFEVGDGQGSGLYPSTMFRIGGVDAAAALAAVGDFKTINTLMAQHAGAYRFPREGAILRPQRDPSEWRANVTQLSAPDGTALNALDVWQLSAGEVEGRRQIVEYMRFLREQVPGFENARIIDIAPQLGVRETRRICGRYALTAEDILAGAVFADRVGINAWPMELHVAGRIEWAFPRDAEHAHNQLPWRMLVPAAADVPPNLLVAGRCASMTHAGQSAARASGACFVMGQAAGTAAALWLAEAGAQGANPAHHLAAPSGTPEAQASLGRLQQVLQQQGACLELPTGI